MPAQSANPNLSAKEQPKENLALEQVITYVYRFFWVIDILVVVLVLGLSNWFLLKPKYDEIQSEKELLLQRDEYSKKQEYLSSLTKLGGLYDAIPQADKNKINEIVDMPNEANDLYKELQFLITENKMAPTSIEPVQMDANYEVKSLSGRSGGGPLSGSKKVIKTTIQLSGVTYDNLYRMIERMEYNLRIMDVIKVTFDPFLRTAVLDVLTYKQ